tara:strand:- start:283 stop:537 length:255 start_codon:yes stop_codon:yes gene_type:complete
MSEQIKFTEEELGSLKALRSSYSELSHELGQVQLNRFSLDRRESELKKQVNDVVGKEKSLADELKTKYGQGRIDIDTGVFIPTK